MTRAIVITLLFAPLALIVLPFELVYRALAWIVLGRRLHLEITVALLMVIAMVWIWRR